MSRFRKGSALLELALSASALVALLAGGIQFGYTFHIYGQLQNALRNGARYASTTAPSEACVNRIRNVVVYGDAEPGAAPVVPGLTPEHVTVEFTQDEVLLTISGLKIDSVFSTHRFERKPLVTAPILGSSTCQ